MRRLFAVAGVDYQQWRALLRAYVLTDYAAALGAYGGVEQRREFRQILLLWTSMPLIGLGPAVVILLSQDVLLGATLMTSTTMLMVGLLVLAQAPRLIAPDDLAIVGFRPVSSRTYFAARATGLLMVVILLGTSAYQSITISTEHQASWFFFTTPSDRVRQVLAARDAVMAVMILPLLALMAGFLTYAYGHAGHALLHAVFFGGIAYLVVQLAVSFRPRIPFSLPAIGRRGGGFGGGGVVLGGLVGTTAAFLLHLFAFPTAAGVLIGLAALAGAIILVNRLARARILRELDAVTYFG